MNTASPLGTAFHDSTSVSSCSPSHQLSVQVVADSIASDNSKNTVKDVLVKIIPPNFPTTHRAPVDIRAVIDISGSMGEAASGGRQDSELSILDVVKHAMRTIIARFQPDDRFSVISFSNDAAVEFPMYKMTDENKAKAVEVIESLTPSPITSTNLWSGLSLALDEFQNIQNGQERFGSIFLLTDGLPNVEPLRGHIPMLLQKKDIFRGTFPTINTFGFGYSLDSQLLNDIAIIGNGQYSFIPDASFVGTVFIHAITSVFSTCYHNVRVSVENVAEGEPISGGFQTYDYDSNTGRGVIIDIGSVMYGQSRDIIIPMRLSDILAKPLINVRFTSPNGTVLSLQTEIVHQNAMMSTEILAQKMRLKIAEFLQTIMKDLVSRKNLENHPSNTTCVDNISENFIQAAKAGIEGLIKDIEEIKQWNDDSDDIRTPKERMNEILFDLKGPVLEAFEVKDFVRWGQHYIPSLARSHLLQICNSFKDRGVQPYIGEFAKYMRWELDDIFLNLPAPTPSRLNDGRGYGNYSSPLRMAKFHNANNPCFTGSSRILMANGSLKRADEILIGENVRVDSDHFKKVIGVQYVDVEGRFLTFANLDGTLLLPNHPVFCNGRWLSAIDVPGSDLESHECSSLYLIILQDDLAGHDRRFLKSVLVGILGFVAQRKGSVWGIPSELAWKLEKGWV